MHCNKALCAPNHIQAAFLFLRYWLISTGLVARIETLANNGKAEIETHLLSTSPEYRHHTASTQQVLAAASAV